MSRMQKRKNGLRRIAAALCLTVCLVGASCGEPPFAEYTLDGGALLQVWGGETGLRRLAVTASDGDVQHFTVKSEPQEPDTDGGLRFVDLNFDGHDDVIIRTQVYASGDVRYACFLWTDGTLVRSTTLESLSSIAVHPETETLTAWAAYRAGEEWESRAYLTYAWHNGLPVPIAKTELIHYVEDEIYCLATYAADPGRTLSVIDEDWIFPGALEKEALWAEAVAAQDAAVLARKETAS